jgi:hypothetical protein
MKTYERINQMKNIKNKQKKKELQKRDLILSIKKSK